MKPMMDKLRTNYKGKLDVTSADVPKDRANGPGTEIEEFVVAVSLEALK